MRVLFMEYIIVTKEWNKVIGIIFIVTSKILF